MSNWRTGKGNKYKAERTSIALLGRAFDSAAEAEKEKK
jgi:hypothetical protein